MREVSRMLAAALAACAAFLALFFALRWHIAVCALLAVGVYFGLYLSLIHISSPRGEKEAPQGGEPR